MGISEFYNQITNLQWETSKVKLLNWEYEAINL